MDKVSKKIVTISKGRVFDKKFGPLYFLIFTTLFPVTLTIIFDYRHYPFIIFALLMVLMPFLMLLMINLAFVMQGIEIDLDGKLIRNFKKIFFLRYGSWLNFNDYKIVSITSDHLALSRQSSGGFESHFYYYVSFVNESTKFSIKIAEFSNYYKAYSFAKKVSDVFNLEINDHIKTKTDVRYSSE